MEDSNCYQNYPAPIMKLLIIYLVALTLFLIITYHPIYLGGVKLLPATLYQPTLTQSFHCLLQTTIQGCSLALHRLLLGNFLPGDLLPYLTYLIISLLLEFQDLTIVDRAGESAPLDLIQVTLWGLIRLSPGSWQTHYLVGSIDQPPSHLNILLLQSDLGSLVHVS